MSRDLDDMEGPVVPARPAPAPPSWEKLGEPMTFPRHRGGITINAAMLRAACDSFTDPLPVASHDALFGLDLAAWAARGGSVERVVMRGEEMWGLVHWYVAEKPPHGIAAALDFGADILTGTPILRGAVICGAEPAVPA